MEGTEAIYSVELGLPAVRQLEGILKQIRDKEFRPDASRAEMWRFPLSPPASSSDAKAPVKAAQAIEVKSESEGSEQSSSSDESVESDSGSSSSSSDEEPAPKRRQVQGKLLPSESGGDWVVHKRSHVWHWTYGVNMLMCGRKRTHVCEVSGKSAPSGPVCTTCRRNKGDD